MCVCQLQLPATNTAYLIGFREPGGQKINYYCRDITGRLTMQTSLGLPEDPII